MKFDFAYPHPKVLDNCALFSLLTSSKNGIQLQYVQYEYWTKTGMQKVDLQKPNHSDKRKRVFTVMNEISQYNYSTVSN